MVPANNESANCTKANEVVGKGGDSAEAGHCPEAMPKAVDHCPKAVDHCPTAVDHYLKSTDH